MENKTGADRAALFLATGCGVGFIPKAPGTFGSLAALVPIFGLMQLPWWQYLLATLLTTFLGIPVCARGARALHAADPGAVVLDEVAGMLWVFAPLMLFVGGGLDWVRACAGFLLFRILDITKPPPGSQCGKIAGRLGNHGR